MRIAREADLNVLLPRYRNLSVSYAPVGIAAAGSAPEGFDRLEQTVRVGYGEAVFERAVRGLLGWEMHRRAGLRVAADGSAELGRTVVLGLGTGLLLVIPCRVVSVVEAQDSAGFSYGTLPGHPECGEESFLLTFAPDGGVDFRVRAYSRPGHPVVRLAHPVARAAQRIATRRYINAMRALASGYERGR